MKTLVVASAKGGSTKSSVCATLGVRATLDGSKVALIDLNDDQGSLTNWWVLRGEPDNPELMSDIQDLPADVRVLAKSGYDFLIIDTPPLNLDLIEQAILVADAVLIPCRPSAFDIQAVETAVLLARKHSKPWAFLLSAVDSRDARLRGLVVQAATVLTEIAAEHKGRLLGNRISYRSHYIAAATDGKTAQEVTKDKEIKAEIDGVWQECLNLLGVER